MMREKRSLDYILLKLENVRLNQELLQYMSDNVKIKMSKDCNLRKINNNLSYRLNSLKRAIKSEFDIDDSLIDQVGRYIMNSLGEEKTSN